jgi:hypothetical protein
MFKDSTTNAFLYNLYNKKNTYTGSSCLPADNSVCESKIENSAVTTKKIANGNVTEVKISDEAVSTRTIANGNITEVKMSD